VRTMSDVTQFLFISHNKITMEMANQLIGITMPDPGVSRVVAVDIAEALELAEAAAP
jgi:chromosome segregation protein